MYEVIGGAHLEVNFAPASTLEEIIQNVKTILSTPKYSVPLAREFGVTATWLDEPMPVAQARLTAEIITAVQHWEPRVKVEQVTYVVDDKQGVLVPKVKVRPVEQLE